MEPSSPFLKILPYEVARGWMDGLNSHKVSVEGTANIKLPDSTRAHHVSDYLLAGIERCEDKDQACFFVAYHDDSGRCGCSSNHGVYCGYYGQYGDCISHTVSMLWGDWNVCVIESPRSSLDKISCTRQFESKLSLRSFAKSLAKKVVFSKITPSLFTLKEGSTSHPDPLSLRGEGGNRSSSSLGTATL